MIEGIHLDIAGVRLAKLFRDRAAYHGRRAQAYEKTRDEAVKNKAFFDSEFTKSMSITPEQQAQQKIEYHNQRDTFFSFLAEYVNQSETYRLSEQDVAKYELAVL